MTSFVFEIYRGVCVKMRKVHVRFACARCVCAARGGVRLCVWARARRRAISDESVKALD